MNILKLIGRDKEILLKDIQEYEKEISSIINESTFLIIGGAGSIGQALVKEIFVRNPKKLFVVDISENNLVELVRDIRSSIGYIKGDFQVFALDSGSEHFFRLIEDSGPFDFVMNLSALKHVRSEKDPYTLSRLIEVNILNVIKCIDKITEIGCKKYFAVSTDKATNPANLMGASKYIMERYLINISNIIKISSARFANVAFSDGSLLHGFEQRIKKFQPLSAPNDVKRYFISSTEAGRICLISSLLGDNRDIFFPKLSKDIDEITFSGIAVQYLKKIGKIPKIFSSEDEARNYLIYGDDKYSWPCYFFKSDTSGEKNFEEFYSSKEILDMGKFNDLGIVKNPEYHHDQSVDVFVKNFIKLQSKGIYERDKLVKLFKNTVSSLSHKETGKYLDSKM